MQKYCTHFPTHLYTQPNKARTKSNRHKKCHFGQLSLKTENKQWSSSMDNLSVQVDSGRNGESLRTYSTYEN